MSFEGIAAEWNTGIIKLYDACIEAYFKDPFNPRDGMTFCDEATQYIAEHCGYKGFRHEMNADGMIDHIRNHPELWEEVVMADAQEVANSSHLVIAGLKSTEMNEVHGHAAVVLPSFRKISSGKWAMEVPIICNIGQEKRESLLNGANEAFGPIPKFYKLKEPIV